MKPIFKFQAQFAIAILIAIFVGYAFQSPPGEDSGDTGDVDVTAEATETATALPPIVETPTPIPTPTRRSDMFVTLEGVWMVSITMNQTAPPEIRKLVQLDEGRLTPGAGGAQNLIQLLDDEGNVLYEISFVTVFMVGEPPVERDSVRELILLPNIDLAVQVRVITDQGEVVMDLEK